MHKGNFNNTENFFNKVKRIRYMSLLKKYGEEGVQALSESTPKDSGATASSWYYEIIERKNGITIQWCNNNIPDGIPVAILIQYGHATRNGGYVEGLDYINPAMRPIFDKIANDVWREVTSA